MYNINNSTDRMNRMIYAFMMDNLSSVLPSFDFIKYNQKENYKGAIRTISKQLNEAEIEYNEGVGNIVHEIFWDEANGRLSNFSHQLDGINVLINAYDYFVVNQSYKFDGTFIKSHEKILSSFELYNKLNLSFSYRDKNNNIDGYKVEDFIHHLNDRIEDLSTVLTTVGELIDTRIKQNSNTEKYQFITDFKKYYIDGEPLNNEDIPDIIFPKEDSTKQQMINEEYRIWIYPYQSIGLIVAKKLKPIK